MSLPPFQTLVDAHGELVHRFLVAAVGVQDAEDCFQETFLAALRSYPSLRDASNLRGWLLTIARSKALDERRSRVRRPVAVERVPDGGGHTNTPSDGADVWSAVRRLPDRQRDAILYRYGADLPYRAVAAIVGGSEEAARQNVREGLRRLRQTWTR